jgi:hypothetical protein
MLKYFFSGISFLLILFSGFAVGSTIHVPGNAGTIQEGINSAQQGDTVLVDEGTYYENIKFKGKSIIVASKFILDHNPDHILNTIINGSMVTNPDSASCVIFNGEDSNAVLQGFTLTEGGGTIYFLSDLKTTTKYDGKITVEGGGIFFNESNATVKNNLIINNHANAIRGYNYNGGGGISTFCSNPKIYNNIIINNRTISANGTYAYAAGIVLNESQGVIRNNIIYHNTTTGRGALFIDINLSSVVENNTIVGNICNRDASGIFNRTSNSVYRNNIVWKNIDIDDQVKGMDNDDIFEYCFTDQVFNSTQNIFNSYPEFSESKFMLDPNSPCIDAGNPDIIFGEIEDSTNPGYARLPSLGSTRNDIGAYGGPFADVFPDFNFEDVMIPDQLTIPVATVNKSISKKITLSNLSTKSLHIDSITVNNKEELSVNNNVTSEVKPMQALTFEVSWKPLQAGILNDTLKIYHNLKEVSNPVIVNLEGTASGLTGILDDRIKSAPLEFKLMQNYPNPFNPATQIKYSIPNRESVSLKVFDSLGREIKTLVNEEKPAGSYQVEFYAANLSSGIYFYRIQAGSFNQVRKMLLLK